VAAEALCLESAMKLQLRQTGRSAVQIPAVIDDTAMVSPFSVPTILERWPADSDGLAACHRP